MTAHGVLKLIGQYRIVRTLGAGGMGTVYLGEHLLLGRRAAIKTLLPSLSSQREIVDRFFDEARAISAISDPGVVQVFDFGYHVDGTAYIVMELLDGESLSARLERVRRLPLVEALRLARQLASSLAAAHERDIIHRDATGHVEALETSGSTSHRDSMATQRGVGGSVRPAARHSRESAAVVAQAARGDVGAEGRCAWCAGDVGAGHLA